MAKVLPDSIDGDVTFSVDGASARRVFKVTELTGAANTRLVKAARAGGIPRVGSSVHPGIAGLVCADVTARPVRGEPTMADVTATYRAQSGTSTAAGETEIEIQSDLIQEETIRDVNGDLLTTSFSTRVQLSSFSGSSSLLTFSQVHRIQVQRPTYSMVFARIEPQPALAQSRRYSGTVNAALFQGAEVDRWLCNVTSSPDGLGGHRVRYSFTHNDRGWQAFITHQTSGIIPTDVRPGNGLIERQVYRRANFNAIGLPRI